MPTPDSALLGDYSDVGPRLHRVATLAEAAARSRSHAQLDSVHLALGLIDEGRSVAASALQFHGFSLPLLRVEVERLLPASEASPSSPHALTLTAEARAVFSAARAEASALGHRYLATEHLLMGLLSEPRAPVAALLAAGGFHLSEARARIRWILEGDPRDPTSYVPPTPV